LLLLALFLSIREGRALHATNADTLFSAYNTAFYTNTGSSGYYRNTTAGGQTYFWGQAEEIEMALDHYDRTQSAATRTVVSNLCKGFLSNNGTDWSWNEYNDDVCWAVIALCRTYQITGYTTFRDRAKANFDMMYARAWDTNFAGGGLFWRTDNGGKNACVNGPAAIAACYLYDILGDSNYLAKAQACYEWERRVLFKSSTGGIYDSISTSSNYNTWASTYNQGTFMGAGTFLFRYTGLPFYIQDAVLAANYTRNSLVTSGGVLLVYSSGDLAGFHGILARWMGKLVKDQGLGAAFNPWLGTNADAAWKFRNTNNLAWYNWTSATPAGTNILNSWDCSSSVAMAQAGCTNNPDALSVSPLLGFTAAVPYSLLPDSNSLDLVLTNQGASALSWRVVNTNGWLTVSAASGTLAAATAASVTVSLNSTAVSNLVVGRYFGSVWITNLSSGVPLNRAFALVVTRGNTPIGLAGCNARIIAPNTAVTGNANASAIDLVNGYSFYQAGLGTGTRGFPASGVFNSLSDTNTVFQVGPYGVTNALLMGYTYPKYGTLSLKTPRACTSLAILAVSANGVSAGAVGTVVLNFTNGTRSQPLNFYAPDWFSTSNNVAIQGLGRYKLATGAVEDNGASSPRLFQTTLDLAALGLTQPIASLTFSNSASAGSTQTGAVLGVSGAAMLPRANIVNQPVSLTNTVPAQAAVFDVAAAGLPPLAYQWYYSASGVGGAYAALAGQTNRSLTLAAELQLTNAGAFYVTVSNTLGMVTSAVATLTVFRAPAITQPLSPTNLCAYAGASRTLSVTATGAAPIGYFWTTNGVIRPGANGAALALNNLQLGNSGLYRVVVSNAYGQATSAVASLAVLAAPYLVYGKTMLTNGALGYWRLDETSGGMAYDLVGTNNGAYSGKVALGQAVDNVMNLHPCARFGAFAASNSCVTNINVDFSTTGNGAFTVEAWVKASSQTVDAGIVTKGSGGGGEQFNLDCGGGGRGFRFFVRDGSGTARLASSSVAPDGNWHHLAGVCDQANGVVNLYVDGTNAAQGTIGCYDGIMSSSLPMSIGARQSAAGKAYDLQFVGYIEDVAVYRAAWSTNQARAHYLAAVTNKVNVTPSQLQTSLAGGGGSMTLSWPSDQIGWRLEAQTNPLSVGLGGNWVTVGNSSRTNSVIVSLAGSNSVVFYRLVYP
jgi:predicted alpha-1,6-mannanase (GH76 family)